jgi:hypothetical protein
MGGPRIRPIEAWLDGRVGEGRSVRERVERVNLWPEGVYRCLLRALLGKPVPKARQQVVTLERGGYDPRRKSEILPFACGPGFSRSREIWSCESDTVTTLTV